MGTDDDQIMKIVCEPYTGPASIEQQLPDSVVIRAWCGHQVFLSFPGQMWISSNPDIDVRTVCTACVPADELAKLKAGEDQVLAMPGSWAELERADPLLSHFPGAVERWARRRGHREFTEADVQPYRQHPGSSFFNRNREDDRA